MAQKQLEFDEMLAAHTRARWAHLLQLDIAKIDLFELVARNTWLEVLRGVAAGNPAIGKDEIASHYGSDDALDDTPTMNMGPAATRFWAWGSLTECFEALLAETKQPAPFGLDMPGFEPGSFGFESELRELGTVCEDMDAALDAHPKMRAVFIQFACNKAVNALYWPEIEDYFDAVLAVDGEARDVIKKLRKPAMKVVRWGLLSQDKHALALGLTGRSNYRPYFALLASAAKDPAAFFGSADGESKAALGASRACVDYEQVTTALMGRMPRAGLRQVGGLEVRFDGGYTRYRTWDGAAVLERLARVMGDLAPREQPAPGEDGE